MILTKKSIVILTIISLCFVSMFFQDNSIAQIGEEKIYEKDIEYQIGIEKCYSEQEITKEIALIQLRNKFIEKEALRMAFGVEPDDTALEEKANWVDENTKAPEILDCVKSVFGDNRKSYLRLYIQPTLVNPKLHSSFSQSREIHKDEIKKIMEMQDEIEQGKEMETFSEYRTFNISKQVNISEVFEEKGVEFQENPLIEKVIKNLKPGEICKDIVEDDYSYQIIRLLKEDDERYYCDGVVVEKLGFDKWFNNFITQNIEIKFNC